MVDIPKLPITAPVGLSWLGQKLSAGSCVPGAKKLPLSASLLLVLAATVFERFTEIPLPEPKLSGAKLVLEVLDRKISRFLLVNSHQQGNTSCIQLHHLFVRVIAD